MGVVSHLQKHFVRYATVVQKYNKKRTSKKRENPKQRKNEKREKTVKIDENHNEEI